MLAERRTGAALGDAQLSSDMLDAGTATRGAWKFPRAASCRISLSSVRSETARRSRLFSVSRSFRRFTWSIQPPELLPPAVIGHLRHPDRADRIAHALTLRRQNVH